MANHRESGKTVDASGTTASGAKVQGLSGLRALLLAEPEQFPRTVTEKLMAYALGRRLEYYDRPTVRKIVRDAAARDYRWSSLILGIVESPAFLMRATVISAVCICRARQKLVFFGVSCSLQINVQVAQETI